MDCWMQRVSRKRFVAIFNLNWRQGVCVAFLGTGKESLSMVRIGMDAAT